MKIGIDARMLGKGYGIGRYIEQLVLHLMKIDSENQYVLFVRNSEQRSMISDYLEKESLVTGHWSLVIIDIPWYSWQEQIKFKKIIQREKVDLMHFPHWNVPLFYNDLFVVTIHDLIMFHYPRPEATTLGPIKFWLKDKVHHLVLRHAVKKAKNIIAVSEFTKQDVAKTLNIDREKIKVTHQTPFISTIHDTDNTTQILQKYGITKPFVLYVGAAYPHKNLKRLLEAWKILEKKHDDSYQLVLAGKNDYFYERLRSSINDQRSIILTGFVEDDELKELYKNAKLYIFPSLYEGFGLPGLEALVYGLPVISSNRTSLPEILGEAALYFDPENIEQMADIIHAGLTDEEVRFELKAKAKEELKRYSVESLAQETLQIYRQARL